MVESPNEAKAAVTFVSRLSRIDTVDNGNNSCLEQRVCQFRRNRYTFTRILLFQSR